MVITLVGKKEILPLHANVLENELIINPSLSLLQAINVISRLTTIRVANMEIRIKASPAAEAHYPDAKQDHCIS